jgi:hypothetical protein
MRVVQLTPPGSSCAIVFGTAMGPIIDMVPGSVKGLRLVVQDMDATWAALTERGIELSDIEDMGGVLYSYFSDPDVTCGRFSSGQPVTRPSPGADEQTAGRIIADEPAASGGYMRGDLRPYRLGPLRVARRRRAACSA